MLNSPSFAVITGLKKKMPFIPSDPKINNPYLQLHIVHMKQHYTDLATALADPEGVAVLGFFYEVNPLTRRGDEDRIFLRVQR